MASAHRGFLPSEPSPSALLLRLLLPLLSKLRFKVIGRQFLPHMCAGEIVGTSGGALE